MVLLLTGSNSLYNISFKSIAAILRYFHYLKVPLLSLNFAKGIDFPTACNVNPIGLGTPSYLSIDGFEDCLDEHTTDGFTSYCFPKEKPVACMDDSWSKILEEFPGDKCPDERKLEEREKTGKDIPLWGHY